MFLHVKEENAYFDIICNTKCKQKSHESCHCFEVFAFWSQMLNIDGFSTTFLSLFCANRDDWFSFEHDQRSKSHFIDFRCGFIRYQISHVKYSALHLAFKLNFHQNPNGIRQAESDFLWSFNYDVHSVPPAANIHKRITYETCIHKCPKRKKKSIVN